MQYYGNEGFIFAWGLGVSFMGIPNLVMIGFSKKFFQNFGLKGVIEKCVSCVRTYRFIKVKRTYVYWD